MDPLIRYRNLIRTYMEDLAALVQNHHPVEKTGWLVRASSTNNAITYCW